MMHLPNSDVLQLELRAGWLTVWLNQPDSRNALTAAMTEGLVSLLQAVRERTDIRGITLRGKGGVFCAGGDLKSFKSVFQGGGKREDVVALSHQAAEIMDLVNGMPQVVVVLIEGAAMAGGFGVACCADVVLCTHDAKFALTETMIGLSPAQISPFVIQRLGYATARRLMLTAARFGGAEAVALGFADFCEADVTALEAREMEIRKSVLRCAPGAVAATKSLILALPGLERPEQIAAAAENFADRILSDEGREGVASFVEKRSARWCVDPELEDPELQSPVENKESH